jgi:hypothetical protein
MWYDPAWMSFLDDLLRTLRAPLDFVRGRTSAVRGAEGRVQGDLHRIRHLPTEFKAELNYDKDLVKSYGRRAGNLKDKAQGRFAKNGNAGAAAAEQGATSKKMGFFSKKKRCPSCNEKLDARWELCPYCGFGAEGGGDGGAPGGPPRTQALDAYGQNNASGGGGGKPRTMALDMGAGSASGGSVIGWLIPLDGPQGGQLLELRGRAIVGTANDCDVVIRDQSVSGRHAEFGMQGGTFRVNDLGSTNGTFVNGKRVQNTELSDGDPLRLGSTEYRFKST